MRVRVELRRKAGRFIPRYRPQEGITGELLTLRKEIHDRQILCLCMHVEPRQGYPGVRPKSPELFEPRLLETHDEVMRFSGWEVTEDLAWHVQEWDCVVLPVLHRR